MYERALIDELMHNATMSGNQMLERRMADLAVWFYQNRERISVDNLAAKQAFLEKGFWTLLEINAMLLQRLREKTGSKDLWVPSGMVSMEGRRFS